MDNKLYTSLYYKQNDHFNMYISIIEWKVYPIVENILKDLKYENIFMTDRRTNRKTDWQTADRLNRHWTDSGHTKTDNRQTKQKADRLNWQRTN